MEVNDDDVDTMRVECRDQLRDGHWTSVEEFEQRLRRVPMSCEEIDRRRIRRRVDVSRATVMPIDERHDAVVHRLVATSDREAAAGHAKRVCIAGRLIEVADLV